MSLCSVFLGTDAKKEDDITSSLPYPTTNFHTYFQLIIDKISNNNYQELLRLSEFTEKHYFSNFDYLISERSNLALYYRGIRTMNINDDTRKTFKAFFSNKINEFHKEKGVEKHKKI